MTPDHAPDPRPSKLVHNERTKLTATMLNGAATTTVAAGVITPLIAWSYGVTGRPDAVFTVLLSAAWLVVGSVLHLVARSMLGRLRE